MNDTQWIRAIEKYSTDRRTSGLHFVGDFLKGGADELASELEKAATEMPARFARLALLLPGRTAAPYFDAVLRGVAASKSSITVELTTKLVERCHTLPGRPCGRWIGGIVRRLASDVLPPAICEALAWYASHDPDPGEEDANNEPLHRGLNSVRGQIASCISAILAEQPSNLERLQSAIVSLISDPSCAVRSMAAEILLMIPSEQRPIAENLFIALMIGAEEELLNTRFVQSFIWRHMSSNLSLYLPIVRRMLSSLNENSRVIGARNAVLVALDEPREEALARACRVSDDDAVRSEAARVYAANLAKSRFRAVCEGELRKFFQDESAAVRRAAGSAIWRMTGIDIAEYVPLCESFLASPAFVDDPDQIFQALQKSTARVPELLLHACDIAFTRLEAGQQNLRFTCMNAFPLLVRAYADSRTQSEQECALDLIDRALRAGLYGMSNDLDSHDRGWL